MMEPLFETNSPLGEPVTLFKRVWKGREEIPESLSIVTGLHGHSLTGLHTVMRLSAFLDEVVGNAQSGYQLTGTIQLFPVIHFRALEAGAPTWNFDHLDTNVAFPGTIEGELTEKLCNTLLQHTVRSDYAIVLKGPDKWRQEVPHVSMMKADRKIKKLADAVQLSVALLEDSNPLTRLALLKQWQDCDLKALAISTGGGNVLDRDCSGTLLNSLINFLLVTGLLTHPEKKGEKPDTPLFAVKEMTTVSCRQAGFFLSDVAPGVSVDAGQKIGQIQGLYDGKVLEEITAPESGTVFAVRQHPLVCSGEGIAWLLTKKYSRLKRLLGK